MKIKILLLLFTSAMQINSAFAADLVKHLGLGLTAAMGHSIGVAAPENVRPNIIIIMTDDMGFSDLGCYGGEIETPNLDMLAKQGLRFTQFYNEGVCVPTRISLLTGLHPKQTGDNSNTRDKGLSKHSVTLAEAIGPAGYRTYHTGKWMVGHRNMSLWPVGRGFNHSYGCPEGGGVYFRPSAFYANMGKTPRMKRSIARDREVIYDIRTDPPKGWYATDAWTEEGIDFVREAVSMKQPFLWYLAYNAPHWPLKAKPEDIAKYRGKYKVGWDKVRQRRYESLVKSGIVGEISKLSPRGKKIPAWDSLSEAEKDKQDLRMATYAAMVDCVDQNIGKIVRSLKELGVYENTVALFLSDNGGDAGGGVMGSNTRKGTCGTAESHAKYGECWANVCDTPFREYKLWLHEGGVATPLIAHWPKGIPPGLHGTLVTEPTHTIDLMATCVDLSGGKYPETYKGNKIIPMAGKSLRPLFEGKSFSREDPIYFNLRDHRAIRKAKWKLISVNGGQWELYDMQTDRTELNNMAAEFPEKVKELSTLYHAWSDRCDDAVTKRKANK